MGLSNCIYTYVYVCATQITIHADARGKWKGENAGERLRPLNQTTYQLPIHFISRWMLLFAVMRTYAHCISFHYTRALILAISSRFSIGFHRVAWLLLLLLLLWLLIRRIHFNDVSYFLWIPSASSSLIVVVLVVAGVAGVPFWLSVALCLPMLTCIICTFYYWLYSNVSCLTVCPRCCCYCRFFSFVFNAELTFSNISIMSLNNSKIIEIPRCLMK